MTKQRVERLKSKIEESRGRLMESNPFFGMLLMYLRYVAVYGMNKMSTDGICVYFSPDFLDKLYEYELDFLFCHQILHILLGHVFEHPELVDDNRHLACDIKVNAMLYKLGFTKEKYPHLGDVHRRYNGSIEQAAKADVQEIYEDFIFDIYAFDERLRRRYSCDSCDYWYFKEKAEKEQVLIIDFPDIDRRASLKDEQEKVSGSASGTGEDTEKSNEEKSDYELKQEWKKHAVGSMAVAKKFGRKSLGDNIGFLERDLLEEEKPSLDWRKLLNNFIQENIADYSFSPPDRRFEDLDLFLPDFNEKDATVKDLLFMVDTSGSVDAKALTLVYAEIKSALEQFNGKLQGHLGFFDVKVYDPKPFESVEDILSIKPMGGGGTNFHVVFDYAKEHLSANGNQCLIIFTDGIAPYPEKEEVGDISVMWVLDNENITPPFGLVVRTDSGM